MPRRKRNYKRRTEPDSKYNSVLIMQLINRVMLDGKKSTAEGIVYGALEKLASGSDKSVVECYEEAIKNAMPIMEVKSRRVGGSTYQVPVEVRKSRSISLAMRWIVGNARKRSGKTMVEKLGSELLDVYNKVGVTIKKREDTHKMAEANKAFAHFRW